MREIEKDGFITREEDLVRSGKMTAKPIKVCEYPKCEECDEYFDGYCTVPMVVSKQMMFDAEERISRLEKAVSDLEETLIYALYGIPQHESDPFERDDNITWDEYITEEEE